MTTRTSIMATILTIIAISGGTLLYLVANGSLLFLRVHENSMRPGLCPGDIIVVHVKKYNRMVITDKDYLGKRVVLGNKEGTLSVKRIAGLEGDQIEYSLGMVKNLSTKLPKTRLCGSIRPKKGQILNITVDKGQLFFAGTNLPVSLDSRTLGTAPLKTFVGDVVFAIPMRVTSCQCPIYFN